MKNILFAIASILILFACTQKHETHDDDTSVKLLEDIIDTTATAPVQIIEPEEVDMGLRSVKAKFIDFELGDAEHYSFQDEQGNYWEFSGCDDTEIEFGIELDENEADERNQGWGANYMHLPVPILNDSYKVGHPVIGSQTIMLKDRWIELLTYCEVESPVKSKVYKSSVHFIVKYPDFRLFDFELSD